MTREEAINHLKEILTEATETEHAVCYVTNGDAEALDMAIEALKDQKTGKWTEKHHAYSDEESVIEEWQSCRCSECGRYDTRPYMYFFDEPNYCSFCGAKMEVEHETD